MFVFVKHYFHNGYSTLRDKDQYFKPMIYIKKKKKFTLNFILHVQCKFGIDKFNSCNIAVLNI